MTVYQYLAKSSEGKSIRGTLEASDRSTVIAMLKDKGYFPVRITEQGFLQQDIHLRIGTGVKIRDLAVFCRQFATIINAGVSVLSCLDILRQQTENKVLNQVIQKVYESVRKGNSLSSSMKEHKVFPPLLLHMVEAGELSGNLDVSLERMAVHYEKENKIRQKIKGALTYPVMISIVALGVIGLLLTFVVPNFVSLFDGIGIGLPATTMMLLAISDFIRSRWYILLAAIVLLIAGYRLFIKTDSGALAMDAIKLKAPGLGQLIIKVTASYFTRSLGTLLGSGLPLITALEITTRIVDNQVVIQGLNKVREEVIRGMSLSQPLEKLGVFPPMVTHMIRIGEDTGAMEKMLEKTADFYDDEIDTAIIQMTSVIEPLIIVVMAVVVGFIILSIIQPMFSLFGGLGSIG